MTVYDIIKNYGYDYIVSLVENKTTVYTVNLGSVILEEKLTGIKARPIEDNELVFETNWNFLHRHIFLSREGAENYVKKITKQGGNKYVD